MNFQNLGFIQALSSSATKVWASDKPGIDLIKGFEGCRLNAYPDSGGVWTIGWGSTRYANGVAVKRGDRLLNVECANDLLGITMQDYEREVRAKVLVPISQNQYDALVSFQYNCRGLNCIPCTLLNKLNAGDYAGAADQFLVWNKVKDPKTGIKKPNAVLTARRTKERKLFLTP